MKRKIKKQESTFVPEINFEANTVKKLNDSDFLTHISIDAGISRLDTYLVTPIEIAQKTDAITSFVETLSAEQLFFGEPNEICSNILIKAKIWNNDKELAQEQLDYLRSELGDDDVDEHIKEFGKDFRYLGAKKVLELRKLSFSSVWYALGVLICKEHYDEPFQAGAIWALLTQKLSNEGYFLSTENEANKIKDQRVKGSKETHNKAEKKRQCIIEIAVKMATRLGVEFWILKDVEKAEKIRNIAIDQDCELFLWGGKLHDLSYFLNTFEDNKIEITEAIKELNG